MTKRLRSAGMGSVGYLVAFCGIYERLAGGPDALLPSLVMCQITPVSGVGTGKGPAPARAKPKTKMVRYKQAFNPLDLKDH